MKQTTDTYQVTSTVPTETKIAMGIRTEDMAHVMSLLTAPYSDNLLAIIREYSTNALDAHVDAGVTKPIEVTLPSALTPFLVIRDYGDGLDETDIAEVYSQYGRSTKRESNDVVGMLGIGCKSGLAYTSQFTVTSIKAGIKTVVIVSREGDGSGSMTPLSADATDEPNGTEVRIAINRSDYYNAEAKAKELFSVWRPGTVLVNGKQPEQIDGLRITDDLMVVDRGSSRVVMGNVPYPAPQLDDLCPMGGVVAHVKIGAVTFPPSREALNDDKQSRATLESIRKRFVSEAKKAVQREIDKASTPGEAVNLALRWDRYMPNGGRFTKGPAAGRTTVNKVSGYTFKGVDLPAYLESENEVTVKDRYGNDKVELVPFTLSSNGDHRLGTARDAVRLYTQEWKGAVWVENYEPAKFTAQHKRKLRAMVEQKGIEGVTTFVCVHGKLPSETTQPGVKFIEPTRILDWPEVKAIKLDPRPSRAGQYGRIPGSYDLITEDGHKSGIPGDQIRQSSLILYYHGNGYQARRWVEAVAKERAKFTIVLLSENRIAKFKRNVPGVLSCREFIGQRHAAWLKELKRDEKDALKLADDYLRRDLLKLDAGKVDDPALKHAIKLCEVKTGPMDSKRDYYRRLGFPTQLDSKIANPFAKYPLFDLSNAPVDHVHAYLNWTFGGCK